MREEIERVFDARIQEVYGKKMPRLLPFFIKHERKARCLDNLCDEIKLTEWKMGAKFEGNHEKFRNMVSTVADMFCQGALRHEEFKHLSPAEQYRRRQEKDLPKDVIDFAEELNEEEAKLKRGQIIGAGWNPAHKNKARGRKTPKLIIP